MSRTRSRKRRGPSRQRKRSTPRTEPSARPKRAKTPVASSEPRIAFQGFRKSDVLAAAAVGVAAAATFLSTFSPHVALGDAPESVAGVRALGILHAPGYPTYVLAARAFGTVVPIGSWGLRVGLFSVACATAMVVVVDLVARAFGASTTGAAIGALALATSASSWLNADFAKHYPLSGLLVAASLLLVVLWEHHGHAGFLVGAGALLGGGLGAAWELTAIMAVGLAAFVAFGARRPRTKDVVAAVGALFAVALAVIVFIFVRAAQDPTLNWGDVTNLHRLVALISQRDFRDPSASAGLAGRLPSRTIAGIGGIVRDMGAAVIALAACGAISSYGRRERAHSVFLPVVGAANVGAVILLAGFNHIQGFATAILQGGFLLDVMVVIAILAALGATRILDEVRTRTERPELDDPAAESGGAVKARRRRAPVVAGVVLAAVVLVPSVVVHRSHADLRAPPIADTYADRVLASLPQHSVLVVLGSEFAMPMIYRQVVYHDRPDVTVVSADLAVSDWGSDQLTRRFHLGRTLDPAPPQTMIVRLIAKLRETHTVFLDVNAMQALPEIVGYRTQGYVAQVVDGVGPQTVAHPAAVAGVVNRSDTEDGLAHQRYNRFPFRTAYYFHERAHLEVAKAFALRHDVGPALDQVRRAVAVFPDDTGTRDALREMTGRSPQDVERAILAL